MYPLYMLFALAFLIGHVRFSTTGSWTWAAGSIVSLAIAMMANVAAASMVGFCLYWQLSRREPLRLVLGQLAPAVAVSAALMVLVLQMTAEQAVTSMVVRSASEGLWDVLFNSGRNILLFLSRLVTLAHWVPFPLYNQFEWEMYSGAVLLIVCLFVIFRRQPGLSDAAVWILMFLIPFLPIMLNPEIAQQLPQGPSKYLYAPSVGIAMIAAWLARQIYLRWGKVGVWMCAGAATILAVSSYGAIRKVEGLSYYAAARNLTFERRMHAAATHWERAVAQGGIAVPLPDAYVRLIKNRIARGGDYQSTMSEALQRLPDNRFLATANRALELFEGNRARGGTWQLEQEPSQDPNMNAFLAGIFHNLGLRYARQGDSEWSIVACRQALRFEPDRATTLKLLAGQLVEAGRLTELEELSSIASVGGIHLTGVTICSVHGVSSRWQALPGLGWRVSSLVSNRCGLPGLPRMAAVARRLRLSELRPRRRLALGRWPLHVSGVFDTQFGDGRYDLRSDADTLDDMVHRLLAVRHR